MESHWQDSQTQIYPTMLFPRLMTSDMVMKECHWKMRWPLCIASLFPLGTAHIHLGMTSKNLCWTNFVQLLPHSNLEQPLIIGKKEEWTFSLYVPEIDPVTGQERHDPGDHNHLFRCAANSIRQGGDPSLNFEAFDDVLMYSLRYLSYLLEVLFIIGICSFILHSCSFNSSFFSKLRVDFFCSSFCFLICSFLKPGSPYCKLEHTTCVMNYGWVAILDPSMSLGSQSSPKELINVHGIHPIL